MTVHDHSQPCEHGSLWPHWIVVSEARWWQEPDCLGGKQLTLRRIDERTWEEVDHPPIGDPTE